MRLTITPRAINICRHPRFSSSGLQSIVPVASGSRQLAPGKKTNPRTEAITAPIEKLQPKKNPKRKSENQVTFQKEPKNPSSEYVKKKSIREILTRMKELLTSNVEF